MDELARALAAAQPLDEAALRAEVEEKLRTQEATVWFGQWAAQVGMPTLTLYVGGRPATQVVGAQPKAVLLRMLAEHLPASV